jgi:folate-dependent phosphoribosylglycinamide formyltransferase PurN
MENDTVDSLAERVLAQEHLLYVETLRKICEGTIVLSEAC